MDWKKIKENAWKESQAHIWDVWKPLLVIGLICGIVGAITANDDVNIIVGIIASLVEIFLIPAEVGVTSYMLNLVRGKKVDLVESLTKYYTNNFTEIILIALFTGLYVALGIILLVIPGIIIALSYAMNFYIYVDDDKLTYKECMAKSKEMMNGYKKDYFLFGLSFIGWTLLCVLVIPAIWVIPYITYSQAMYYDELKKKAK